MLIPIIFMNPVQAAEETLEALEQLRNDVGIPQVPFKDFDLTEEDVEHTAKWAVNDISGESNPRNMSAEQMKNIMRSCI